MEWKISLKIILYLSGDEKYGLIYTIIYLSL